MEAPKSQQKRAKKSDSPPSSRVALAGLVLSFLLILSWEYVVVPVRPGQQGVYWSRFFGGTQRWILSEGSHLKFPWDEVTLYDLRHQEVSQTTNLLTVDGLTIEVQWSARYLPSSADLPQLHRSFGPDYEQKLVVPEIVSALRQVIGNFRADEIYAEDEAGLLGSISTLVQARFKPYPVTLETVLLTKLSLPQNIEAAIGEKLIQEQRVLSYRFRLRAEAEEKERRMIEAEGLEAFERISGISPLTWRGVDATVELSKSPNTKIILLGTDAKQLPILLNTEQEKAR